MFPVTMTEFSSLAAPSPGDAAHGGRGKLALSVPTRAPARVFLRISTRLVNGRIMDDGNWLMTNIYPTWLFVT